MAEATQAPAQPQTPTASAAGATALLSLEDIVRLRAAAARALEAYRAVLLD